MISYSKTSFYAMSWTSDERFNNNTGVSYIREYDGGYLEMLFCNAVICTFYETMLVVI